MGSIFNLLLKWEQGIFKRVFFYWKMISILLSIIFHGRIVEVCFSSGPISYRQISFFFFFLFNFYTYNYCNFDFNHETNVMWNVISCIGRNGYCLWKALNDVSSSNLRFRILMRVQYMFKKLNLVILLI